MAKFTILGETNSGKTCYLLGMYFKMSLGISGYTIVAPNSDDAKFLTVRYEWLNDKARGKSRFPAPTDQSQKINFNLQYAYKKILSFEWIDYPGNFLDPSKNDVNSEQYKEVEKSIKESDALFICVDGENLRGRNIDNKIRKVKHKCARNINPYLGEFDGNLPPIGIIITKYDLCEADTNESEVKEIIEEAFEGLFKRNNVFVAIIPVSLGANFQDDDYSGDLEPLNIHLPILMGINFALIDKIKEGKALVQRQLQEMADVRKEKRDEEDSFFLWRSSTKINLLKDKIADYEQIIAGNKKVASYLKKSMYRVNRDLEEIDMIFANGNWQDKRTIHRMWEDLQAVADYF